MAYTPPSVLNFDFRSTYTPTTTPLTLNFLPDSELYPSSISESAFGTHTIYTRQFALAAGFDASAFGVPLITLETREILVGGIATPPDTGTQSLRQVPSPGIDYRRKIVSPTGIPAFSVAEPIVTHYTQYVDVAGRGIFAEGVVGGLIAYRVRYITTPFIFGLSFGTALAAQTRQLRPTGFDNSAFGTHALDINLQRIFPDTGTLPPERHGDTAIRNVFERIRHRGADQSEVMFPVVFNRLQIVRQSPFMNTNSDTTSWPPYSPTVANRNRTINPSGFTSSRFSALSGRIYNKADPLLPEGLDATLWGPKTFISHKIRTMFPQGWSEFVSSAYSMAYNAARVLYPVGIRQDTYGLAATQNLNRTVRVHTPYGGETVGTAFTAYRIRYVAPGPFRDQAATIPGIRYNPYPIAPGIIPVPQFGATYVEERFTIVRPSSTNVHDPLVGEHTVVNHNKTIRVSPTDMLVVGRATVVNYITYVSAGAGVLTRWGTATTISYRTKTLVAFSTAAPTFPYLHQIRNLIPDPPGPQRIEAESIGSGVVPAPVFSNNRIYTVGFSEAEYGIPRIRRNTIAVGRGIFNMDQVGIPLLVATQYLYPKSVPAYQAGTGVGTGSSDLNRAKPRVSPHTIYAPSSDQATQQAVTNHSGERGDRGHLVDDDLKNPYSKDYGWPFFGFPEVANKNRSIGPIGVYVVSNPVFPTLPTIDLFNRRILPTSIRPSRFGHADLGGGVRRIRLEFFGISTENFEGRPTVAFPPAPPSTPVARPIGIPGTEYGVTNIELFNREITPQGIPHRGNPEALQTNPWGVPLVGYPVLYVIGGYSFTLWGTARVEHRIRTLFAEGHDSCTLRTYDVGSFDDRMRVTRRNPYNGLLGIAPLPVPAPVVTHGIRTVYARGPYGYVGGAPSVRAAATIAPAGWDSLVVGDVDRWESGKIKPYGSELSTLGTPRMVHTLRPSGIPESVPSNPRMARLITAYGMPPIGFDGPSLTDLIGCNNRVVVVLPIIQPTISSPVVGHL
jgi:hypothetical protein